MQKLIFIPVIEAVKHHVSVRSEQLDHNSFKILDDSKFELEDETILYKFLPGDIVEVSLQELKNVNETSEILSIANKLIGNSSTDRKLKHLQYLIADQEGILTEQQSRDYTPEINELKISLNEVSIKVAFHPAILLWYNMLQNKTQRAYKIVK